MTYPNLFYWLQKSLYGLKNATQTWYEKINRFFVNLGFKHCESNHSIYVFHIQGDTFIVVVYVDEFVLTGNKLGLIFRLKS